MHTWHALQQVQTCADLSSLFPFEVVWWALWVSHLWSLVLLEIWDRDRCDLDHEYMTAKPDSHGKDLIVVKRSKRNFECPTCRSQSKYKSSVCVCYVHDTRDKNIVPSPLHFGECITYKSLLNNKLPATWGSQLEFFRRRRFPTDGETADANETRVPWCSEVWFIAQSMAKICFFRCQSKGIQVEKALLG